MLNMLTPVLALVVWTLCILALMASRRLPVIFSNVKKGIIPPKRNQELVGMENLSDKAVWTADNSNHLHEQPTIFYALCVYSHLVGVSDIINVGLAFAYVGLRVVHSLIQCSTNNLLWRFRAFILSSVLLVVIAGRNVWALVAM